MKELVEVIAKALVEKPDEVVVTETRDGNHVTVELKVAPSDMGKQRRKFSVYDDDRVGDFRFVFIRKKMPMKSGLPAWQDLILRGKYAIRAMAGKDEQWYGLDTAVLIHETVPLFISPRRMDGVDLKRITEEPEK